MVLSVIFTLYSSGCASVILDVSNGSENKSYLGGGGGDGNGGGDV